MLAVLNHEGVELMPETYNIYCDESCHLEHDQSLAMVLGGIWADQDACQEIAAHVRGLKQNFGLPPSFEVKWVKVSPAKVKFYESLIDYFFDEPRLRFRAVVVPNKRDLRHFDFSQNHDDWYYKMWFVMLKQIFLPQAAYRIYIDIKDTRSQEKVEKLHKILCNSIYDFDCKIIHRVQQIQSHESDILQLADLLIGCLSYLHRALETSRAKRALIQRFRDRSGLRLLNTTLPKAEKVNLLIWRPQEISE
jgi:hypothetical protein